MGLLMTTKFINFYEISHNYLMSYIPNFPNLIIKRQGKLEETSGLERYFKKDWEQIKGSNSIRAQHYFDKNVNCYQDIAFNKSIKLNLTKNLNQDVVQHINKFFVRFIPSKNSPNPIHIVNNSTDKNSQTSRFFNLSYQACNYTVNHFKFDFDNGRISEENKLNSYYNEIISLKNNDLRSLLPMVDKNTPKIWDYNGISLLGDEFVRNLFKDISPDQFAYDLSRLVGIYMGFDDSFLNTIYAAETEIGSKDMPNELKNTAKHYLTSLNSINTLMERHGDKNCNLYGPFSEYRMTAIPLARFYSDWLNELTKGFSESKAIDYILSNPKELDDFLWNEDALNFAIKRRKIINEKCKDFSEEEILYFNKIQKIVVIITDKIDELWKNKFEKEGIKALLDRFGHPVGIPTKKLQPWHFIYGGFLVESGFINLEENINQLKVFDINLKIDNNGVPIPNTLDWDTVKAKAYVSDIKKLKGLGDLSEACASGNEAWHVIYNRGLPKDSLYMAASLSNPDSHITGSSYDDITGTVYGVNKTNLNSIAIALGRNFMALPTATSKIVALSGRFHNNKKIAPNGLISLKEIDLSNWRITRLSDNFCGNEYGLSKAENPPFNFDKLSRSYHEGIQNSIRNFNEADGIITYCENKEELFRTIVGKQRGESYRLFIESPGTYIRRTGKALHYFQDSPAFATYQQICQPLTPTLAFRDTLTGNVNDGTNTASPLPGTLSLFPQNFCAKASGTIKYGKDLNIFPVENFNKLISIGPGRRGENYPLRLRFAGKLTFGEKSSDFSGLLSSNITDDYKKFLEPTRQIHNHIKDIAILTKDNRNYSDDLINAHWHIPEIWARDFELGEMGEAYRIFGQNNEQKRKQFLQNFLDGKMSDRHQKTISASSRLTFVMSYKVPADPDLTYGLLDRTGQFYPWLPLEMDKDRNIFALQGHIRALGNHLGEKRFSMSKHSVKFMYRYRPSGMFFTFENNKNSAGTNPFFEVGSNLIPQTNGIPCLKGGYSDIGLNDTPVFFDSNKIPYIRYIEFIDSWVNKIYNKGVKGEYETYELIDKDGKIFSAPMLFKELLEKVKTETSTKDNQILKGFLIFYKIFGHPCRYRNSLEMYEDSSEDISRHNSHYKF